MAEFVGKREHQRRLITVVVWLLESLGWRQMAFISGILVLVVGLPVTQVVRRRPEDFGRVAVADASGKTHEFQASKETLQELRVGDRIEAKLRAVPNC